MHVGAGWGGKRAAVEWRSARARAVVVVGAARQAPAFRLLFPMAVIEAVRLEAAQGSRSIAPVWLHRVGHAASTQGSAPAITAQRHASTHPQVVVLAHHARENAKGQLLRHILAILLA